MGSNNKNNRPNDSTLTKLLIVKTVIDMLGVVVNVLANLIDTSSK